MRVNGWRGDEHDLRFWGVMRRCRVRYGANESGEIGDVVVKSNVLSVRRDGGIIRAKPDGQQTDFRNVRLFGLGSKDLMAAMR